MMIDGAAIYPKKRIEDDRGAIFHMLRSDDPEFDTFGEIYFSKINPGVVKGWHFHQVMTLNYLLVSGAILLVLYDDRPDSPTRGVYQEIPLSREEESKLVKIPPRVWNGFKGLGSTESIVANLTDVPHDKNEISRRSINDPMFEYDWAADPNLPHG